MTVAAGGIVTVTMRMLASKAVDQFPNIVQTSRDTRASRSLITLTGAVVKSGIAERGGGGGGSAFR